MSHERVSSAFLRASRQAGDVGSGGFRTIQKIQRKIREEIRGSAGGKDAPCNTGFRG